MSVWYEPKPEDIEVNGDELDIYVTNDESGAIYVSVKIKELKKIISGRKQTKRGLRGING